MRMIDPVALGCLLSIAVMTAGCGGSPTTPSTGPSPAVSPAPTPSPTPAPSPTPPGPLQLGAAAAIDSPCPAGSPSGTQCRRLQVSCPSIAGASATLRITSPSGATARRGTIVVTTGGDGTSLNGDIPLGRQMIGTLTGDGMLVVELAWGVPGIWGGPQARTLACRYATAARWVYDNLHGGAGLFAAQGTSGGSSQIAFALAHYGLSDIIGLANLGGGPPGCPLCSPDGQHGPEPLLPGPAPSVNRDPRLNYPTANVRFFLGDREPTPEIIADANAYYSGITSAKSMTTVPNTEHNIEATQAGVDAYVTSVRAALSGR